MIVRDSQTAAGTNLPLYGIDKDLAAKAAAKFDQGAQNNVQVSPSYCMHVPYAVPRYQIAARQFPPPLRDALIRNMPEVSSPDRSQSGV